MSEEPIPAESDESVVAASLAELDGSLAELTAARGAYVIALRKVCLSLCDPAEQAAIDALLSRLAYHSEEGNRVELEISEWVSQAKGRRK